jgi:3D (Asp-Asp-Asp) domain-containing protein
VRRALACAVVVVALAVHLVSAKPPGTLVTDAPAHRPFLVLAPPRLGPLVVRASPPPARDSVTPAVPGSPVRVRITAYCLRGLTRLGEPVREGLIAADPRLFPLGRDIDVYLGGRLHGRFRVSDTGRLIKGPRLDIWTPSCADALRFGRRRGSAVLVAAADR